MSQTKDNLLITTRKHIQTTDKAELERGIDHLNALTTMFHDYFAGIRYDTEESVRITDRLDSTVRFIGAPISVLKPYVTTGSIPEVGAQSMDRFLLACAYSYATNDCMIYAEKPSTFYKHSLAFLPKTSA